MRVRNLPAGTQEGLLQQALEKHALIKRVEVFHDLNEADVELENAAVCLCSPRATPYLLTTSRLRLIGSWETPSQTRRHRFQREHPPVRRRRRRRRRFDAGPAHCSTCSEHRNVCSAGSRLETSRRTRKQATRIKASATCCQQLRCPCTTKWGQRREGPGRFPEDAHGWQVNARYVVFCIVWMISWLSFAEASVRGGSMS